MKFKYRGGVQGGRVVPDCAGAEAGGFTFFDFFENCSLLFHFFFFIFFSLSLKSLFKGFPSPNRSQHDQKNIQNTVTLALLLRCVSEVVFINFFKEKRYPSKLKSIVFPFAFQCFSYFRCVSFFFVLLSCWDRFCIGFGIEN